MNFCKCNKGQNDTTALLNGTYIVIKCLYTFIDVLCKDLHLNDPVMMKRIGPKTDF